MMHTKYFDQKPAPIKTREYFKIWSLSPLNSEELFDLIFSKIYSEGGVFPHIAITFLIVFFFSDVDQAVYMFKLLQEMDPYRIENMDVYSNVLYVKVNYFSLISIINYYYKVFPVLFESFCDSATNQLLICMNKELDTG